MDEQQRYHRIQTTIKNLLNTRLKDICRAEGLAVTGVKAVLQDRVSDRLRDLYQSGDFTRFNEFCDRITRYAGGVPQSTQRITLTSSQMGNGYRSTTSHSAGHSGTLTFPDSPFFTVLQPLTPIVSMPVVNSQRSTVNTNISLVQATADSLKSDSNLRLLLYCSADPYGPQPNDIAFPSQVEVKVNGEAYTGNTRGVKKKPGTTHPADITPFIRKQVAYNNSINVTYAATDKRYAFIVNLVRKHPVPDLVERISQGHVITERQVLNEMISKANDPDIVATSSVMSLRCPISAMRMALPCRSTVCSHVQCFDATSFLQSQEQAPQWACPICTKRVTFTALVVDQYVQGILRKTSSSVDQVTIEPTGEWRSGTNADSFRKPDSTSKSKSSGGGSDDIVEISDHRINGIKHEMPLTPLSFSRGSMHSSREPSASVSGAPRSATGSSSKRSAEDVIDLTLSDDEDAAPRPVKRQSTSSVPQWSNTNDGPSRSNSFQSNPVQHTNSNNSTLQNNGTTSNQSPSTYYMTSQSNSPYNSNLAYHSSQQAHQPYSFQIPARSGAQPNPFSPRPPSGPSAGYGQPDRRY